MVSQLKVNEIIKQSGSSISIGVDGDTVSGPFTNVPAFHAHQSSAQSIANTTGTVLTYGTEIYDTDNAFSSTTFTIPSGKAGKYFFYAVSGLNDATPARMYLRINQGGNEVLTCEGGNSSSYNIIYVGGVLICSAGDLITSDMYHNAGSSKNTFGNASRSYFGGYRMVGV